MYSMVRDIGGASDGVAGAEAEGPAEPGVAASLLLQQQQQPPPPMPAQASGPDRIRHDSVDSNSPLVQFLAQIPNNSTGAMETVTVVVASADSAAGTSQSEATTAENNSIGVNNPAAENNGNTGGSNNPVEIIGSVVSNAAADVPNNPAEIIGCVVSNNVAAEDNGNGGGDVPNNPAEIIGSVVINNVAAKNNGSGGPNNPTEIIGSGLNTPAEDILWGEESLANDVGELPEAVDPALFGQSQLQLKLVDIPQARKKSLQVNFDSKQYEVALKRPVSLRVEGRALGPDTVVSLKISLLHARPDYAHKPIKIAGGACPLEVHCRGEAILYTQPEGTHFEIMVQMVPGQRDLNMSFLILGTDNTNEGNKESARAWVLKATAWIGDDLLTQITQEFPLQVLSTLRDPKRLKRKPQYQEHRPATSGNNLAIEDSDQERQELEETYLSLQRKRVRSMPRAALEFSIQEMTDKYGPPPTKRASTSS